MGDTIFYKGYMGNVVFSVDESVLKGSVLGIKTILSYKGKSVDELINNFRSVVDSYLEACRTAGKSPEKPGLHSMNIEVASDVYSRLEDMANERGKNINGIINDALVQYVKDYTPPVSKAQSEAAFKEFQALIRTMPRDSLLELYGAEKVMVYGTLNERY